MEAGNVRITDRQLDFDGFANNVFNGENELVEKRLNELLALNRETERKKAMFRFRREELESELMARPLSIEKTFSRFGLLLGTLAPAAIFTRVFIDSGSFQSENCWILGVLVIVNLLSAVVGYFSGGFIGRTVFELEQTSWTKMILTLPFVGMVWGILAGGAGGIIVLFFGAFFGAALGALVGSVALPLFAIFHRLLKCGDKIEEKQFLPLAYGVALAISAFILGL